jgi:hypothetical protein
LTETRLQYASWIDDILYAFRVPRWFGSLFIPTAWLVFAFVMIVVLGNGLSRFLRDVGLAVQFLSFLLISAAILHQTRTLTSVTSALRQIGLRKKTLADRLVRFQIRLPKKLVAAIFVLCVLAVIVVEVVPSLPSVHIQAQESPYAGPYTFHMMYDSYFGIASSTVTWATTALLLITTLWLIIRTLGLLRMYSSYYVIEPDLLSLHEMGEINQLRRLSGSTVILLAPWGVFLPKLAYMSRGPQDYWYSLAQCSMVTLTIVILSTFALSYYFLHVAIARTKSRCLDQLSRIVLGQKRMALRLDSLDGISAETAVRLLLHNELFSTVKNMNEWPLSGHALLELAATLALPYFVAELMELVRPFL